MTRVANGRLPSAFSLFNATGTISYYTLQTRTLTGKLKIKKYNWNAGNSRQLIRIIANLTSVFQNAILINLTYYTHYVGLRIHLYKCTYMNVDRRSKEYNPRVTIKSDYDAIVFSDGIMAIWCYLIWAFWDAALSLTYFTHTEPEGH